MHNVYKQAVHKVRKLFNEVLLYVRSPRKMSFTMRGNEALVWDYEPRKPISSDRTDVVGPSIKPQITECDSSGESNDCSKTTIQLIKRPLYNSKLRSKTSYHGLHHPHHKNYSCTKYDTILAFAHAKMPMKWLSCVCKVRDRISSWALTDFRSLPQLLLAVLLTSVMK